MHGGRAWLLSGCCVVGCVWCAWSQEPLPSPADFVRPDDSTRVRVLQVPEEAIRRKANRSLYFSLLLPGLGQAYNGELWKIPVVYAGLLSIGSYALFFNDLHQNARIAERREQNISVAAENPFALRGRALRSYKEYTRRNRDLLIILGVTTYALQALEAHVSAYLRNFSVKEARVWMLPSVETVPQYAYGVRVLVRPLM